MPTKYPDQIRCSWGASGHCPRRTANRPGSQRMARHKGTDFWQSAPTGRHAADGDRPRSGGSNEMRPCSWLGEHFKSIWRCPVASTVEWGLSCSSFQILPSKFESRCRHFLHQGCHEQELTLPGTLIALDFPVEARRELLRDECGAMLTARLRKCFTRRVSAQPKTKTLIRPGSRKNSQMKTVAQFSYSQAR